MRWFRSSSDGTKGDQYVFTAIAIGVVTAILVAGSTVALAQSNGAKKPLDKMTCCDFLTIEDRFQPKVVYSAAEDQDKLRRMGGAKRRAAVRHDERMRGI